MYAVTRPVASASRTPSVASDTIPRHSNSSNTFMTDNYNVRFLNS
jgi:hypothetical protein